jgi:hypothetical protein
MMRRILALALAAMMLAPACAQAPAADDRIALGDTTPPDYAKPENWMCRPGVDDGTCSAGLDAMAVDINVKRTPAPFVAAPDPKVDCFFVYPTTSLDPTMYSDLIPDAEEKRTVHGQAARLREKCRLFVPIYHSFTMAALRWTMAKPERAATIDFDPPYRSVLAAWRAYLARDNKGRGVVLVGHSQGAILLKRLIAEEIDGKPAQKRLVAAYLAGNLDLSAKSFKSIPPCAAPGQTGCVVAWSSYRADYAGPRMFGGALKGEPPLCVNPAALAGGRGLAKAYLSKPSYAPAGDPPYVELVGQLSAECVSDAEGAVLRFRVEPGPVGGLLESGLARLAALPAPWGMHPLDISLVQGNMVDLIGAQAEAWKR